MLDELVLDLGEGDIGAKVRHYPLQRPRTAAMAHLGADHERTNMRVPAPILNLFYGDFAKGAVPAEFFLPPRQVPRALPTASADLAA